MERCASDARAWKGLGRREYFVSKNWQRHVVKTTYPVVLLVAILGAWEALARKLPPAVLATPIAVAQGGVDLLKSGSLERELLTSAGYTTVAFVFITVTGVLFGLIIGNVVSLRNGFAPIIYLFNSLPIIALLPVITLWFGVGRVASVIFIVAVAEWSLVINTIQGVKATEERLTETARSFRLSKSAYLRYVTFPGCIPYIFAGLRISMTQVIIAMIIVGQEIGQTGLGGAAEAYGAQFDTAKIIVVIFTTGAFALVCFATLRRVRDWVAPWVSQLGSQQL